LPSGSEATPEDPFDAAAVRALAARISRTKFEDLLRRAIELAPGWIAPKANLALVLGRTGGPAEAMDCSTMFSPSSLTPSVFSISRLRRLGVSANSTGDRHLEDVLDGCPIVESG
jgi:hypothetical protein